MSMRRRVLGQTRSCGLPNSRRENKRLVVMGAAGVGKTCLLQRLLDGTFECSYKATVEDYHRREFNVDGTTLQLEIIDTSGAFSFPAMRRLAIATGDVFVLVYAVDDRDSAEEVLRLWNEITEVKERDWPAVIVAGNKSDLRELREVDKDTVERFADHAVVKHIETSAKEEDNVDLLFKEVMRSATDPQMATSIVKRQASLPVKLRRRGSRTRAKPRCVLS